ncbi:LysR family transcriptional regulator [Rhodoferax sp.]|uniref:LysR family transcriptional regulator n=1 Tax=Rhodoferax sp. TaxID=50421 RepID=UPI00283AFE48|nr:LysR family transcriptional regulator [Rhodoferax sp.]MDR3371519.1 LysR family transcriptional regulator [Rhodoferax sp.]
MKARINDEITFRKLEIFLAFMRTGNLSKAAEAMETTAVSVHRALHSLEEGLRCQLFSAKGRNLVATPAATIFEEAARNAVEQILQGITQTRALAGFASNQIRIGSLYSLTAHIVPKIIMDIKLRRPDLHVNLALGSDDDLLEQLAAAQIDAVLMGLPSSNGQIEAIPLFEDDIFLAVNQANSMRLPDEIDLRDLSKADFVSLSGGFITNRGFVEAFRVAGFMPNVVTQVGDIFSLMSLVAGGVGYTLLPGRVRHVFGERVKLIPLQPRYRMRQTIGLVFLRARERDPNILALSSICRISTANWGNSP